jgi:hypothetical protein
VEHDGRPPFRATRHFGPKKEIPSASPGEPFAVTTLDEPIPPSSSPPFFKWSRSSDPFLAIAEEYTDYRAEWGEDDEKWGFEDPEAGTLPIQTALPCAPPSLFATLPSSLPVLRRTKGARSRQTIKTVLAGTNKRWYPPSTTAVELLIERC